MAFVRLNKQHVMLCYVTDLKVPMLLAVLVVTDNEFQTVGAALVKQ